MSRFSSDMTFEEEDDSVRFIRNRSNRNRNSDDWGDSDEKPNKNHQKTVKNHRKNRRDGKRAFFNDDNE